MGKVRKINRHAAKAEKYARDVTSGKILACKWVALACERHLRDLKRKDWEFRFDESRAADICEFIEGLPHVKGRWKSKAIELEPWQCFFLCVVFGWVDHDGMRRFRTVYVEVPRKNAKTTICSGIALYLTTADGEDGAEVYSAAVTRDQARISFDIARRMARKEVGIAEALGLEVLTHSLVVDGAGSSFKPLASDADGLDGLNIHGAIIDELHAHKTREVFDAIDDGTGSRRQPLKWQITTAGSNQHGICYEQRSYVVQILEGRVDDERYFGIIYTIDEDDDWTDPEIWAKANPNLGVSIFPVDIETSCKQAQANPGKQNDFKTKRLNVWVSAGTAYFNSLAWDKLCRAEITENEYRGEQCFFGLDLASKWDVAAFMRLYKVDDEYAVFGRYYLPEDALEKGRPNYDIYQAWANAGRLVLTPGAIIDFQFIERDLLDFANTYTPEAICYDPHQATELATRMVAEGLPMVEVPQNISRLSEPMQKLGALILSGDIKHDGDPVLSWMISNTVGKVNYQERVFPTKDRAENKIDGAVATMLALSPTLAIEDTSISPTVRAVG